MDIRHPFSGMAGRTVFFIGISYFVVFIGQNIWRVSFQNLAIEIFDVSPVQMGIAYSLVSIPGLFSVSMGFVGAKMKLLMLLLFSFLLMGFGLIGTGLVTIDFNYFGTSLVTNWYILLFCLLLLHSGFAAYYPAINTVFLLGVESKQAVKRLSSLKSLGPLAGFIGAAAILLVMSAYSYISILAVAGVAVLLAGVLCVIALPSGQYEDKQHMLRLKKTLIPYYLLNFLNGCKSAIFKTFVIYYLITEFHFELKSTATLVLAGNIFTFAGYQLIGRLARRYDPAKLLGLLYLIMCFNFLFFMWLKNPLLLSLIFLLDSLVFCTSAITDSYLKFLSADKELLGDLATGVSLYHLGGVIMPIAGGLLYARNDAHAFLLGSLCTLFALIATKKLARQRWEMKTDKKR
jgi:hypothetical protein